MRESVEEENQALAELKNATLRNKNALQKENDKLSTQVEKVRVIEAILFDKSFDTFIHLFWGWGNFKKPEISMQYKLFV